MKPSLHFIVSVLIGLIVFGCAAALSDYAEIKDLSGDRKDVTIDSLITNWQDYDIYYTGLDVRATLGIMFDPKENHTKLTGDQWKKVEDHQILLEAVRWIYPHTQFSPRLVELRAPDNRFLGYLYYAWGPVSLKKIDDKTFYMFHLVDPNDIDTI